MVGRMYRQVEHIEMEIGHGAECVWKHKMAFRPFYASYLLCARFVRLGLFTVGDRPSYPYLIVRLT